MVSALAVVRPMLIGLEGVASTWVVEDVMTKPAVVAAAVVVAGAVVAADGPDVHQANPYLGWTEVRGL